MGMPNSKHPELKGNLIVEIEVKFPEQHFLEDESKYRLLASALPIVKQPSIPKGEHTEVSLMEYEESRYGRTTQGAAYEEDSDEEAHTHGGATECTQS